MNNIGELRKLIEKLRDKAEKDEHTNTREHYLYIRGKRRAYQQILDQLDGEGNNEPT